MGTSHLTEKQIKNMKKLAILDHLLYDCPITFDHSSMITSDSCKKNLLIKRSLLIKHGKPVLSKTIK